ncbi:MAG: lipocalin family protein [Bacteroidales bacterium]|nr:lipocalin family protein [Bacteroidales bacterium]
MKNAVYWFGFLIVAIVFGTSCKSDGPFVINGIVMDASMNNVTLITGRGDTVNISTMDANPDKVHGVLIDDSVKVTYVKENMGGTTVLKATELVVTKHSPYYYIQGTWLEPNPINPKEKQGITLNQDGTAASVNMATLVFENWNLVPYEYLILESKSIGNGQTIESEDTLRVDKLDADSLVLSKNGFVVWRFAREE